MVTTLKDTDKPVTDISFPALTFCCSGVHLNNVERKLILDFKEWRAQENRNETTKAAIEKDTEEFMLTRFQIQPSQAEEEHSLSILDILDTMIAPKIEDSISAHSVREQVIACKQIKDKKEDEMDCKLSCPDSSFTLFDKTCLFVSKSTAANYANAESGCKEKGALLVTIKAKRLDDKIRTLTNSESVWIGLRKNTEGTLMWRDKTTDIPYKNWAFWGIWPVGVQEPNGDGECIVKAEPDEQWAVVPDGLIFLLNNVRHKGTKLFNMRPLDFKRLQ